MIFKVENKKVFSPDIGKSFDKNNHSVILLHGSGQSHVVWSLTDQYIADQGFNVFALDFPGHGNSEGSCLKSIEEMSIWLHKVVKQIGIKSILNTLTSRVNVLFFGDKNKELNRSIKIL